MERELFIGVDVSKRWLDLAYYDGVNVDWKHGHIRVDNKESGFVQIGKWCRKIRSQPSRLPAPAYFKLKRLIAERRQYVVQSALYKQQLHDVCDYDTDGSVCRKKEELKSLMAHVRQTDAEILSVMEEDACIKKN